MPQILRSPERTRFDPLRRARPSADPEAPGSLWLEASVDGRKYDFELTARQKRAIMVGSVRNADISIDDARVSLIELHFERGGDRVFVVPAYGARVEINAVRLRRPEPIRTRAVIAFAGHVLRVRILDTPPTRPLRLAHTMTETDPPAASPPCFGNDTVITAFAEAIDDGLKPEAHADSDDANPTLIFRARANAARSATPPEDRTRSETPLAKLVHELPTPRAAPLEFSELLALRAAAEARLPARRASIARAIGFLVASTLSGFALGFAAAHVFPQSMKGNRTGLEGPRTGPLATSDAAEVPAKARLTRR